MIPASIARHPLPPSPSGAGGQPGTSPSKHRCLTSQGCRGLAAWPLSEIKTWPERQQAQEMPSPFPVGKQTAKLESRCTWARTQGLALGGSPCWWGAGQGRTIDPGLRHRRTNVAELSRNPAFRDPTPRAPAQLDTNPASSSAGPCGRQSPLPNPHPTSQSQGATGQTHNDGTLKKGGRK